MPTTMPPPTVSSTPSMRGLLLSLVLMACLFFTPVAVAQAGPPVTASSAAAARNLADFDWVVATVRDSYAGWDTKTDGPRRAEADALAVDLRARVARGDEAALREAVQAWVAWFRDGHLAVDWLQGDEDVPWTVPRRPMTATQARRRLAESAGARDAVEGLWRITDAYTVAVLRRADDPRTLDAVVLRTTAPGWSGGDVKAVLQPTAPGVYRVRYGTGDRTEVVFDVRLNARRDLLDTAGPSGVWRRVHDDPARERQALRRHPGREPAFERIDAHTVYLRVPSFGLDQAEPLRALVERHRDEIVRTPQLIVDVRHNGGGGNSAWEPLLPFLYSRPTYVVDREFRVSPENLRLYRDLARQLQPVRPDVAREVEAVAAAMAGATTPYVRLPGRGFRIVALPEVLQSPRRVAILVDGAASAAEDLLLAARQSRKVTLAGQRPSAGVADFAEMMRAPAPSGRLSLAWATTRTLRLPEDPVDAAGGIAPDLWIPAEVDDPVLWTARALRRGR